MKQHPRFKHGGAVGKSHTAEYASWNSMKTRCLNPNSNRFHTHGGRGIKICKRWLKSFENFLNDMGKRPAGMSLERKNNSRNYTPGNCIWATAVQQSNNTRRNVIVKFGGKSLTLMQWSRCLSMPYSCLKRRLQLGWGIRELLKTPLDKSRQRFRFANN